MMGGGREVEERGRPVKEERGVGQWRNGIERAGNRTGPPTICHTIHDTLFR